MRLRNGRYNIQSFGSINHAHVGNRPRVGDAVEGRSTADQWIIQETNVKGQYTYAFLFHRETETRGMNNVI